MNTPANLSARGCTVVEPASVIVPDVGSGSGSGWVGSVGSGSGAGSGWVGVGLVHPDMIRVPITATVAINIAIFFNFYFLLLSYSKYDTPDDCFHTQSSQDNVNSYLLSHC
jgi:hypothetical protein